MHADRFWSNLSKEVLGPRPMHPTYHPAEEDRPRGLAILDGPRRTLDQVHPTLAAYFGSKNLALGGGTALAARWHHRVSTDIHPFVRSWSTYAETHAYDAQALQKALQGLPHLASVTWFDEGGKLEARLPGGEMGRLTWAPSRSLTQNPVSAQFVEGTQVPLERSAEILAKKLFFRMFLKRSYPQRDLYDISWAARYAPRVLERSISVLSTAKRVQLSDELEKLPGDWMERSAEQPLDRPADSELAREAVSVAWEAVSPRVSEASG